MKSMEELTRTTQFVRCVDLNFGNTTNFRNHLTRYHPELGEKQRPVADNQQENDQAGGGTA